MDPLRLTLAICAALLAFGFLAFWLIRGRQQMVKHSKGALLYSLLLFASAAVLYRGAVIEQMAAPASKAQPTPSVKVHPSPSAAASPQPATPDSTAARTRIASTDFVRQGDGAQSGTTAQPQDKPSVEKPRPQSGSRSRRELLVSSDARLPAAVRDSKPQPPVEDVIEAGVLHAFDLIEVFFEEHGSASAGAGKRLASTGGAIEFARGSSQLNEHSLSYLRSVASQLKYEYSDGQIEIRAQTNETIASAEERLMLTQSRAEAVRNVLAAAGFPADRLVPVGSETAGENRVKFVHRPN